jgi:hypothetical protein
VKSITEAFLETEVARHCVNLELFYESEDEFRKEHGPDALTDIRERDRLTNLCRQATRELIAHKRKKEHEHNQSEN